MAVAWKEYWANSTPGTGALTIAPAADDFLIGSAIVDNNNAWGATPPTGWTEDADTGMTSTYDNGALYACSKKATGSETSVTFAHQFGSSFICNVASYSGVDTTTQKDVAVVTFASSVGGTTTDVNITPVTNGCGIAFVMGPDPADTSAQTQTYTTQAGTTGAWTTQISQANGFYKLSHGSCVQTTAGAITARCTTSITGGRLAVVYALRPAAGGGGTAAAISSGTGTSTGRSASVASVSANSTGTGTATSRSASLAAAAATSSGVSTATAGATTSSETIASADASSAGTAVATGLGASLAPSPAASTGTGNATGVAASIAEAGANSAGTATATGRGASLASVPANAAGVSTATAVGESAAQGATAAYSAGTSSATATGKSIAASAANSAGISIATARSSYEGIAAPGHAHSRYGRALAKRQLAAEKKRQTQDERDLADLGITLQKYLEAYYSAGTGT